MKKNEFYEGMVTSLKFPNKGIVFVEVVDAYVQVIYSAFSIKESKEEKTGGKSDGSFGAFGD